VVTGRDRKLARQLPEEFLEWPGVPVDRVVELLVKGHWMFYEAKPRAELAEALLPTLKRLLDSGAEVTEVDRDICEAIVASWIARQ
jgi:hypothetical protein